MADPIPARAAGTFYERAASARLRGSFAATWINRMDAANAPPIVVMPDATVDLQWIRGSFRIAGPDKEPQTEVLAPDEVVIGFRFHPAAAAAWLGVPLVELVGQRLPLDDVWGARARRLASRVRVDDNVDDLIYSIEEVVTEEITSGETDNVMRTAHWLIKRGPPPGAPLVPWLMRALEMSERTLRRRFHESFGYGPKTLDRILRYQRFLRLSNQSSSSTAVRASEAGYSDQAHLIRESRRLTGSTPQQLDRLLKGWWVRQINSEFNVLKNVSTIA